MAALFAGTSGFAYPSWKPDFYPKDLPAARFLSYYATRLNAVECNYSFRRLLSEKVVDGWLAATPEGFQFAVKAHMRITHILRLRGVEEATKVFLNTLSPLRAAGRLGPILFQLPPNLKCSRELLAAFLGELPKGPRYVMEFRHESWFDAAVLKLLESENVALCRAETDDMSAPDVLTADFVYFRLRKSEYTPEQRASLAEQSRGFLAGGRDVFAMFKHEDDPAGAAYAVELLDSGGQA